MKETTEADDKEELDDWYEHHRIVADPGQKPLRIDKFLFDKLKGVSRNRIQEGVKAGAITVNDKVVKTNFKIKPHDVVSVSLPYPQREGFEIIPEDIPLEVVYEDEHVMVINKQAGLVVHPGVGNHSGTLVNALAYYFEQKKFKEAPTLEGNDNSRPYLVHRIDKDTSGLMVLGKTEQAVAGLGKQFFDHTIERRYQAIVWGQPDEEAGTIEVHVGRHQRFRQKMDVYPEAEFGKHAITHYKLVEGLYYVSLVECELETGRTHQIRVHMSSINHPLFNDAKYDGARIRKGTVFSKYKQFVHNTFEVCPRQALHAKVIGFEHPITKEKMWFDSELPDDMQQCLDRWRRYVESRKDL